MLFSLVSLILLQPLQPLSAHLLLLLLLHRQGLLFCRRHSHLVLTLLPSRWQLVRLSAGSILIIFLPALVRNIEVFSQAPAQALTNARLLGLAFLV